MSAGALRAAHVRHAIWTHRPSLAPQPGPWARARAWASRAGAASRLLRVCLALTCTAFAASAISAGPDEQLRQANALARGGDLPGAVAAYRALAAEGHEDGAVYWNWAQAATARGALGEALWALLRAREIAPGDAAVGREIERLRQAAGLDPAELSPRPLAALGRTARRLHLGLAAAVLLVLSLAAHAAARALPATRWPVAATWVLLATGILLAAVPLISARAAPQAVIIRRGAPLADAASTTAAALATLREGEVVPVLAESGGWLRVEDSSGARGWVARSDAWPLDRPPAPPSPPSTS